MIQAKSAGVDFVALTGSCATQTLKHPNTQTLLRHVANHEVVEYHTIGAIQPHSGLRLRSNRSTPDTIGGYSS